MQWFTFGSKAPKITQFIAIAVNIKTYRCIGITKTAYTSYIPYSKELTPYSREPFLRRRHLCNYSRFSQHFMEPDGSLSFSQDPSPLGPILSQMNAVHTTPSSLFFRSILILSSCIKFIQWDKKNEQKCNEKRDVFMRCSTHLHTRNTKNLRACLW
jgi:hypothetical protein